MWLRVLRRRQERPGLHSRVIPLVTPPPSLTPQIARDPRFTIENDVRGALSRSSLAFSHRLSKVGPFSSPSTLIHHVTAAVALP